MSRYRVLVSCPLIQDSLDRFEDTFEEYGITCDVPDVSQQLNEAELLDVIHRYHGIVAGDDALTRRVLKAGENLQVISKWGIGTDNVDATAAEELGIDVYNTPGAFTDEVAEVVVGYVVMLTRRLHEIDREVRRGNWVCPRGTTVSGKTFGVIGVGDIGSAVARRAAGLGMDVLGHDVEPLPDGLRADAGVEPVGRDELLSRADVVSLNCNLTEETRGMIGKAELDLLGPDGYLINTARGELVDQEALVTAVEGDRIAGAALDVFEDEPLPPDDPLTELDDVVLGSHNAQNTHEAVSSVNERAIENLLAGLEG